VAPAYRGGDYSLAIRSIIALTRPLMNRSLAAVVFPLAFAAASVAASSASAQAVTVNLAEWKIRLSKDTVAAGSITFRVTNDGTMNHEFFVRGNGIAEGTREVPKGESASLTLKLKAGTYEVYCPLADMTHRTAGMSHPLVIVAADASTPVKKP
jgi:uncharacterized cupredoxin-like copper-binding protein